MSKPRPLAFVVQRYGAEIIGGAESLCRAIAEMLSVERPVEVLTSCASDYMTWRNEYPAGESVLNGVLIRRFPVDFERDHRFHEVFGKILGGLSPASYGHQKALMRQTIGRSSPELQRAFFVLSGPYSTPLLDFLEAHHPDYELVIFFTYLYATTYFGSQRVPAHRTVLVPTAHDEAPIFLPAFREMFARFPAFIFLSPEERAFIEQTFAIEKASKTTIGMPVELTGMPDAARFRAKYHVDQPFLLYAGRIDPSKGCDRLLTYHRAIRRDLPILLILIGNKIMALPRDRDIRYLGMLPEQDKLDAMAAATVVVNPSPFESFSIVVLEAMLCGTPVLVNGRSEVLRAHVQRSSGGLYYENYGEFVEGLRLMLDYPLLRSRMGGNGAEYVRQNYERVVIEQRYREFIERTVVRSGNE